MMRAFGQALSDLARDLRAGLFVSVVPQSSRGFAARTTLTQKKSNYSCWMPR